MTLQNARKHLLTATILSAGLVSGADAQTVDMLVLYTPEATQTWEGRDIKARIQSFIEYQNRTLANSDTGMQVRVVHTELMNWAGDLNRAGNYYLTRLTNDARVNQLRNQYGADVVTLVYRNPPRESCGMGWISSGRNGQFYSNAATGNSAYNLSAVNCYIHIVAHEAGHNMGLRHSPAQDYQDRYDYYTNHYGTFPYSRGYGVNGSFVTPMAYPDVYGTWDVKPIFSSPRKTCNRQPCGIENHSDAARSLKDMASHIAAFRPTRVGGTPPTTPTSVSYDFENGIGGWSNYYSQVSHVRNNTGDGMLLIQNRSNASSGVIANLTGVIDGNRGYRIQGNVWIYNNVQNGLVSWLYVEDQAGRHQWLKVADQAVAGNRWNSFSGDISVGLSQLKRALLYVYGPNNSNNFVVDNVKIIPR